MQRLPPSGSIPELPRILNDAIAYRRGEFKRSLLKSEINVIPHYSPTTINFTMSACMISSMQIAIAGKLHSFGAKLLIEYKHMSLG